MTAAARAEYAGVVFAAYLVTALIMALALPCFFGTREGFGFLILPAVLLSGGPFVGATALLWRIAPRFGVRSRALVVIVGGTLLVGYALLVVTLIVALSSGD